VHQLGLTDIGADAELDIVQPGTPRAEFYRLSIVATAAPVVAAGFLTAEEARKLVTRLDEPDFLGCGFVSSSWRSRATASFRFAALSNQAEAPARPQQQR
jgi:hypothetical protein